MASVNRVILVGRLGRDPDLRKTKEQVAVASLSLATTRRFKDGAGQQQEETEWHRVVLLGRLAEIAGEYLRKGREAYIEGRLRTRKWTSKDGHDRWTTEIVGEQLQMLGGAGREAGSTERGSAREPAQAQAADDGGIAGLQDDIPF